MSYVSRTAKPIVQAALFCFSITMPCWAAPPDVQGKVTATPKVSEQIRETGSEIARVIAARPKVAEPDKGCPPGVDDRSSDLCAQWKAADAAEASALYSLLGLIATIIGTVLLVWTLLQTRNTARRELRAYVSVKPETFVNRNLPDGGRSFEVEIKMENGGSTPAYRAAHLGNIVAISDEHAQEYFGRQYDDAPRIGEPNAVTIHQNQFSSGSISSHQPITSEQINKVMAGEMRLYAFGAVEYRDTFRTKRETRFCYQLDGDGLRELDQVGMANEGKLVPAGKAWTLSRFFNDAT